MAATWTISDLLAELESDPWRQADGQFTDDMRGCHEVLFDSGTSRSEKADALNRWLAENQPCLFGRMEANQGRLAFCILTENDLERSDGDIRARIEHERTVWRNDAR